MPINELNPQEFAKNLAQQAMSYLPEELTEEQKKYISKKVYEFCFITGDHLIKQYKEQFTDEEAVVVIQFIGEWTFHKAIDTIRGDIENKYWDQILQQTSFAVLKSALHAHSQKLDQPQTAALIEAQVQAAYKECLNQLVKANAIQEDKAERAVQQSNVDKMAKDSGAGAKSSPEDEEKTLKRVAIALTLKNMPQSKVEGILANMDEAERQQIMQCLQIKDLEKKVDPRIMDSYMQDLQKNIALKARPSANALIKSFKALQAKYGPESIINLTIYERPKVQEFISSFLFENDEDKSKAELSPYITKILHNYLKSKLVA